MSKILYTTTLLVKT